MANVSQWFTTAGGNDTGSTPDYPVEGMAPSTVNDTMREGMAAVARWYQDTDGSLDSAGLNNAYTLTTNSGHAALGDQSFITFRADRANTGAATLNVDSLGAKSIHKDGGDDLAAREIRSGQMVTVVYDATDDDYKLASQPAVPSARIEMFGGSTEPGGWKFCNGQAISRTTYSDLFDEVGTTYGAGDGSTTFNVPDLRDRSPLGTGTMGTTDAARVGNYTTALGDSGGEDEHTLTDAEMPSHDHGGSTGATSRAGTSGTDTTQSGSAFTVVTSVSNNGGNNHTHSISSAGGGSAHNTMHPFLAINFIIKT